MPRPYQGRTGVRCDVGHARPSAHLDRPDRTRDIGYPASPELGRPSTEAVRIARPSDSDDRVANETVEIVSIDPTPTSEDLDEEAQTQLWFG